MECLKLGIYSQDAVIRHTFRDMFGDVLEDYQYMFAVLQMLVATSKQQQYLPHLHIRGLGWKTLAQAVKDVVLQHGSNEASVKTAIKVVLREKLAEWKIAINQKLQQNPLHVDQVLVLPSTDDELTEAFNMKLLYIRHAYVQLSGGEDPIHATPPPENVCN